MKWGILGALDAEVDLIRNKMTITSETPLFGTVFYEGTVGREQIVLVCCGVGKVNAAVCAAAVMNQFEADCIINIGIAGAMAHGLKILDIVISDEVGFHDQDEVMLKYYPKRAFFPADSSLIFLCERACQALPEMEHRWRRGRIVSGDVFVNDAAVKQSINERYAPACVEMEGAAVAHACWMNEIPFVIIRCMSDMADDDGESIYSFNENEAASLSGSLVLSMLGRF